jgi:hypothetical protein
VSYTLSQSAGGGTLSSSILYNLWGACGHRPTSKWTLRLSGSWIQNEEIEATSLGGRGKTMLYSIFASATRRISSHISIIGQYSFYIQDQDAGSESVGPVQTGFLSLRYTFDPLVF